MTPSRGAQGLRRFRLQNVLLAVIISLLSSIAASTTATNTTSSKSWKPKKKETHDADLFQISPLIRVNGPSHFPLPTRKLNQAYNQTASVIIKPSFGQHRPASDAIFAYAEGYTVPYYMMFMESLRESGYTGDVVLAIAHDSYVHEGVKEYLLQYAMATTTTTDQTQPNVIVYQIDLDCDGTDDNKRAIKEQTNTADIFQMCRLDHVYGYHDKATNTTIPLKDAREGRVVATLRYEWYWIWSLQYQPHSWLMLIDARDTLFQSNPFSNLPRSSSADNSRGVLYFFGENADAARLGKSKKNNSWLKNGYGKSVIAALAKKPVICSGSTMGEQIAIETYLRALINEHDECSIRMTGSDQGFHNYLYYSGKLLNADSISRVVVWEQGRGIINNLGALREDSLTNWGIRDPNSSLVYQWDGHTVSPVVHQWDRDNEMSGYMKRRRSDWLAEWSTKQKAERRAAVAAKKK